MYRQKDNNRVSGVAVGMQSSGPLSWLVGAPSVSLFRQEHTLAKDTLAVFSNDGHKCPTGSRAASKSLLLNFRRVLLIMLVYV